ncbi:hypothetical protein JCM8208_001052 [Rhodotorula glutinis]
MATATSDKAAALAKADCPQAATATKHWGQRKHKHHRAEVAKPRGKQSSEHESSWTSSWATTITYGSTAQQTAAPVKHKSSTATKKLSKSHATSTHKAASAKSKNKTHEPTTRTSSSSAPVATQTSSAAAGSVHKVSLDLHNEYRAKHGVSALTWSDKLASTAQAWADRCVFEHGGGKAIGAGENLAAWSGGSGDVSQGVQMWYDEASEYDYSAPGFSSVTGHFTQMIWASTTQVGCAVSKCSPLTGDGFSWAGWFYVCEYSAPGNIVGGNYFAKNVLAALS